MNERIRLLAEQAGFNPYNYEGGFKDGALLCYQEIQEHFGIKP